MIIKKDEPTKTMSLFLRPEEIIASAWCLWVLVGMYVYV